MAAEVERPLSPESAEAVAAGMPKCPLCNGQNVRPSNLRSFKDSFLTMFSVAPFRCRVCQHRFYKRWIRHAPRPA
jgi:transposase-like protein